MDQQQEISKIAYKLYLERQGEPGDPLQDWLMAEKIYEEQIGVVIQQTGSETESESTDTSVEPTNPVPKKITSKSAAKSVTGEKKVRR